MKEHVMVRRSPGVGWLTLNRPEALNALSLEMLQTIEAALEAWRQDEAIGLVVIEGAGSAFCAGGDVRALYFARSNPDFLRHAEAFFECEYRVDLKVHTYPKPVVAVWDGVVMGGGVGLTIGASWRIATERTRFAMPEMHIGFYPDVGASGFLSRFPGATGRYLALTGAAVGAGDALYLGAATHYVPHAVWPQVKQALAEGLGNSEPAAATFRRRMSEAATASPSGVFAEHRPSVDDAFGAGSVEAIRDRLAELSASGDVWASETLAVLDGNPPRSLKVALFAQQWATGRTMAECLAMDRVLSRRLVELPDIFEGIRAVLIDKDRRPRWQPNRLDAIDDGEIAAYFQSGFPS